jgi:hypothetical protein
MSDVRVTVATLRDRPAAERARRRLAQAGINSSLAEKTAPTPSSQETNLIELQVGGLDAAEAQQILADLDHANAAAITSEQLEPIQDEEKRLSSKSLLAERAFRAAIVGLLIVPVQLYASWLLVKVVSSREKLTARARRAAVRAAVVNASVYAFGVLLLFSLFLSPYPHEVNPLLYAHPAEITGVWVREDRGSEMKLLASGKMFYREIVEPKCEFSGTWGLGDFQFIYNVRRLKKPGHGYQQGRSYLWQLNHFNENEIVFEDGFGKYRYVRKNAD